MIALPRRERLALVIAGLALRQWSSWHDVLKLVLIGVLLVATGPATVVATARARRTSDG
jgi:multisubunit Na+/H+ antiporter MnhG subunit